MFYQRFVNDPMLGSHITEPVHNYFIVVSQEDHVIRRIVATPYVGKGGAPTDYEKWGKTWKTLNRQYKMPDFDIVMGSGTLGAFQDALPGLSGWDTKVEVEAIKWQA